MVDEDVAKELNKEVVKELCEGSDLADMMMVMVVDVVMKLKVVMEMMLAGQGGFRILSCNFTGLSCLFVCLLLFFSPSIAAFI